MNFYDFEYWPWDKYGTKEEKWWRLSQVPKEWAEDEPMKVQASPYYDAPKVDWYRIELEAEDQYNAIFAIRDLLDEAIGVSPTMLGQYQVTFSEDSDEDGDTKTWEMKEFGDDDDFLPGGAFNTVYMDKLDYAVNSRAWDPYSAFINGMDIIEEYLKKEKGENV